MIFGLVEKGVIEKREIFYTSVLRQPNGFFDYAIKGPEAKIRLKVRRRAVGASKRASK
jgi:hypothetical protein